MDGSEGGFIERSVEGGGAWLSTRNKATVLVLVPSAGGESMTEPDREHGFVVDGACTFCLAGVNRCRCCTSRDGIE